jgi:hypothetical protein
VKCKLQEKDQPIDMHQKKRSTQISDTNIYVENLLNARREIPHVWTNQSMQTSVLATWVQDITTQFSSLSTGNNNINDKKQDTTKEDKSLFMSPSVIKRLLLNHRSNQYQI